MKKIVLAAAAVLISGATIAGQEPPAARRQVLAMEPAAPMAGQDAAPAGPVANPVSSTVKGQMARYAKNMVAAAEAMPADKFNFKPTPEMNNFAHLTMHIAQSNNFLCSKISGQETPKVELKDTDGKDKLVAALKASFEYCSTALASVDDSKLSDPFTVFNRQTSRAGLLITLSDDWYDHYGAQAVYLRLNGILPPSAQPQPAKQ